jgi:hypothetical protein
MPNEADVISLNLHFSLVCEHLKKIKKKKTKNCALGTARKLKDFVFIYLFIIIIFQFSVGFALLMATRKV